VTGKPDIQSFEMKISTKDWTGQPMISLLYPWISVVTEQARMDFDPKFDDIGGRRALTFVSVPRGLTSTESEDSGIVFKFCEICCAKK